MKKIFSVPEIQAVKLAPNAAVMLISKNVAEPNPKVSGALITFADQTVAAEYSIWKGNQQ